MWQHYSGINRKKEDLEILSLFWPKPIAKLINSVYALSEKSNDL